MLPRCDLWLVHYHTHSTPYIHEMCISSHWSLPHRHTSLPSVPRTRCDLPVPGPLNVLFPLLGRLLYILFQAASANHFGHSIKSMSTTSGKKNQKLQCKLDLHAVFPTILLISPHDYYQFLCLLFHKEFLEYMQGVCNFKLISI